jgi:hypothetical protein
MLDLKIIPNINNNSDFYIFFCEKNFSFNSKKLSFIDVNYKEINALLLKIRMKIILYLIIIAQNQKKLFL